MNRIAEELDKKLQNLDPERARELESMVRDAIARMDAKSGVSESGWPEGYFESTAGSLAGERFERGDQGELPKRDEW